MNGASLHGKRRKVNESGSKRWSPIREIVTSAVVLGVLLVAQAVAHWQWAFPRPNFVGAAPGLVGYWVIRMLLRRESRGTGRDRSAGPE